MANNIALSLERLNSLRPLDIARDEAVKQRFILIYSRIWARGDEKEGEAAYEREVISFNKQLSEGKKLLSCTRFSIFSAFIDLAVSGLSLQSGSCPECYLLKRSTKVTDPATGRDIYEDRCYLSVSGYGELVMRERSGQIRHADNPVVVYANDHFSFSDNGGGKKVEYTCNLPHDGQPIMACFMRITRADGSIDYAVMLPEDWQRLSGYSERQNVYYDANTRQRVSKGANALYTSNGGMIDPGFLKAKCIKHAFKSYPKVKVGGYTVMETEISDEENTDYYGISEGGGTAAATAPSVDTSTGEVIERREEESFAQPRPVSAGVTVEPEGDDDVF